MNTKGKISSTENKTTMTASALMRWAGFSAMAAGLCFLVIGMYHPVNEFSAVTTSTWVNVHIFAFALGSVGVFGMAGLYARQAEKSGWLGLIGFILFSVWMIAVSGVSFVEAFILPGLASESPAFVEAFLGMFSGVASEIDLGILPTLWKISEPLYLVGPLLFGIATLRAGIFPRWAAVLLIVGATLGPVGAMFIPAEYQARVMLPNGFALLWMGYALFTERGAQASEADQKIATQEPAKAA